MAPTVADVEKVLLKLAEEKPGWAHTMESLCSMSRRFNSTVPAIERRLETLREQGKLVRFPVHPSSYVYGAHDVIPKELHLGLLYVADGHPGLGYYHEFAGGPLTLDSRKVRKGALWTGDNGHYFYMEAGDFQRTLERLAQERAEKARAVAERERAEQDAAWNYLDSVAPDARELVQLLQELPKIDVSLSHHEAMGARPEGVHLSVSAYRTEALEAFLEVLRNGVKKGES